MGSAWVSMLAYFMIMVISYVLGQKHYPIPYNLKRMTGYLSVSILLVYLSFYTFKQNIFIGNGLLILFLAGIFQLEKGDIIKLLKTK